MHPEGILKASDMHRCICRQQWMTFVSLPCLKRLAACVEDDSVGFYMHAPIAQTCGRIGASSTTLVH